MQRLIDRGLDGIELVFAANDVMAVGALSAIRDAGLTPGTDVAVAGFDDIPTVRDVTPPLTTVRVPLEEIGRRALRLALGDADAASDGAVRTEVVLRESTPAPRASSPRRRPPRGCPPPRLVAPARRRRRHRTPVRTSASDLRVHRDSVNLRAVAAPGRSPGAVPRELGVARSARRVLHSGKRFPAAARRPSPPAPGSNRTHRGRADHPADHRSTTTRRTVGIIMNGVSGRMGYRQHLVRSILAIREQGGVLLADGVTRVQVEPILVGRSEAKLAELAAKHGIEHYTTNLDEALADDRWQIYADFLVTKARAQAIRKAIAAGKAIYTEKPTAESVRGGARARRASPRRPASRTASCTTSSTSRACRS